mgnify:CR=1 FL=1
MLRAFFYFIILRKVSAMIVKISICGLGNTGAEIVFSLLQERDFIFHINCMDPSEDIMGNYIDLNHAAILSNHQLLLNQEKEFAEADIVFHTAGANIPKGDDRNDVLKLSAAITSSLFEKISFAKQALVIVVANPVEPICNLIYKLQKDRVQICGTGTLLDQLRLNFYIAQHSKITRRVNTLVIGEHGSNMVPIWSQSFIENQALLETLPSHTLKKCIEDTKNAAHQIKRYNGHTKYGVSYCATHLMYAWLDTTTKKSVCSTLQNDYYKQLSNTKYCISMPVKIGNKKIEPYPVRMTSEEEQNFREAAQKIKLLTQEM